MGGKRGPGQILKLAGAGVLWVIGILACLLTLAVIIGCFADVIGKKSLKKYHEIALAQKNYFNVIQYENSRDQYENETDGNAWDHYLLAVRDFRIKDSSLISDYDFKSRVEGALLDELIENRDIERLIIDGAHCKYCSISLAEEHKDLDGFTDMAKLKKVLLFIAVSAVHYLQSGKVEKGIELLIAGHYAAQDISRGDMELLGKLVSIPSRYYMLEGMKYAVENIKLKDAQITGLRECLKDSADLDLNYAADLYIDIFLVLERNRTVLDYAYAFYGIHPEHKLNLPEKLRYYFKCRTDSYRGFFSPFLDYAKEIRSLVNMDGEVKTRRPWNAFNAEFKGVFIKKNERYGFADRLRFTAFKYMLSRSQGKLLETALALKTYRLKKGKYPEALEPSELDLKEAALKDSMSGSSFSYMTNGGKDAFLGLNAQLINTPEDDGRYFGSLKAGESLLSVYLK